MNFAHTSGVKLVPDAMLSLFIVIIQLAISSDCQGPADNTSFGDICCAIFFPTLTFRSAYAWCILSIGEPTSFSITRERVDHQKTHVVVDFKWHSNIFCDFSVLKNFPC